MPPHKTHVRVISDLDVLCDSMDAWSRLFDSQPDAHLANAPAYLWAAAHQPASLGRWQCWLADSSAGGGAGLFGRKRSMKVGGIPLRVLDVGTEFVSDPLIAADAAPCLMANLIGVMLGANADCALIQFGRLTTRGFEEIRRAALDLKLRFNWSHEPFSYIWETPPASAPVDTRISGHARRELGRTERRLRADFPVQIEVISTRCPVRNHELLAEFIDLEASGWKGSKGTSIKHRSGSAIYFSHIVERAGADGHMRWYRLAVDGRAVAMNLAVQTHGTLWIPKTAYDESMSRYRPGHTLLRATLTDCVSDPSIVRCNFVGAPEWLDVWSPIREPHFGLRIFCPNFFGFAAALAGRARRWMRGSRVQEQVELADMERRYL